MHVMKWHTNDTLSSHEFKTKLTYERSTSIDPYAFAALSAHRQLYLMRDELEEAFKHLTEIDLKGPSWLVSLDLRNSHLNRSRLKNLVGLSRLDLSRNQLLSVESTMLAGLARLSTLNLDNNQISQIKPGAPWFA